jgi:hypothetical protein
MRRLKVYATSGLLTICMLLGEANAQPSKARISPEVSDSQTASPKPANPGDATTPDALPDAMNNPRPGLQQRPTPAGQQVTPAKPSAADQNLPPTAALHSQAAIPQNVLFEFLFNNISALNKVADNDDKAGKHTEAAIWRTHDQRGAGLNDAEGQILQEITLDCLRMLKEQDAKFRAAAEKFRAERKPGAPVQIPAELVQMSEDREKIVNDHIERLREALGDASFSKLDTYVHSSFHAQMIEAKPASSSKEQKESK